VWVAAVPSHGMGERNPHQVTLTSREAIALTLSDMPPSDHVVTLLGKPGCHLCEAARAIVARVTGELGVPLHEVDITRDEELNARYWEQIPVTLIDGQQHDFWYVSEGRLRAALTA
jgi:glutaredoxin